jgi:hypothetical protein
MVSAQPTTSFGRVCKMQFLRGRDGRYEKLSGTTIVPFLGDPFS